MRGKDLGGWIMSKEGHFAALFGLRTKRTLNNDDF